MTSYPRRNAPLKTLRLAADDLDRLGVNPLEKLNEIMELALSAYKSGRGLHKQGDAGPHYLNVALGCAKEMAAFRYAKLQAMAITEIKQPNEARPVNTMEAMKVIKSDPFAQKVIEQMDSTIHAPGLPLGEANKIEKS